MRGNGAGIDQPSDTIAIAEVWDAAGASDLDSLVGRPWGSLFTACDVYKLPGRNFPAVNPSDSWGGSSGSDCASAFQSPPGKGHFNQGNYIFADGHAKAMQWGQVRHDDFCYFKRTKPSQQFNP